MGVVTFEEQYVFAIPPAKMFKASVLEAGTLFPKIMPQAIQSVVILEGNGGPGTINQVNFGESSKFKYIKERIEELDTENFKYVTTLFEGDGFGESVEKNTRELKFEASPDGGSICKSLNKYHPIGDREIPEENLKAAQEMSKGSLKAIEAYLLANPDA